MTASVLPPGNPETLLAGSPRRQRREQSIRTIFLVAAALSLVVSILIVGSLAVKAGSFAIDLIDPPQDTLDEAPGGTLGLDSLWGDQWSPRLLEFDIKTLIVGSIIVTAIAMVVAAPIGVGAAVYLSEYANPRLRRILKPILEVLAGIPSVVLGFFALQWIGPNIVQNLFAEATAQSLLAAGLGVGLLTIPLVASVSEDAMQAVPRALREASAGLGARKRTTSLTVVLPAAVSGLVAALIIATSRAIGETMVVFLAAGGSGNSAQFTVSPLDRGSTMTAARASQASGTDGTIVETAFNSLFFVGAVLFLITLTLNVVADRFVRRVRQAY